MIPVRDIAEKKVLVTGASGFIGSHLCRKLQGLGCEVHGITRAKRLSDQKGILWWQSDLSESSAVARLVRAIEPDVVYHLSGFATGSRSRDVVVSTFISNVVSTVNLLSALLEVGCERVVLVGSMEEPRPDQVGWTSVSPYAASKWASSLYGRMFHSLYGLPVVILHVFVVYGPGQADLKKLIPYTTLSLLRNKVPELTSGSREIDWVYVEDVVEGLICGAQAVGIDGRTIDIGSGLLVTVRNIVERIVSLINREIRPEFGALEDRSLEGVRVADVSGAYELLGWKAKVQIDDGLRRTILWYKEQLITGGPQFQAHGGEDPVGNDQGVAV